MSCVFIGFLTLLVANVFSAEEVNFLLEFLELCQRFLANSPPELCELDLLIQVLFLNLC